MFINIHHTTLDDQENLAAQTVKINKSTETCVLKQFWIEEQVVRFSQLLLKNMLLF